jgi:hypothetical protein
MPMKRDRASRVRRSNASATTPRGYGSNPAAVPLPLYRLGLKDFRPRKANPGMKGGPPLIV